MRGRRTALLLAAVLMSSGAAVAGVFSGPAVGRAAAPTEVVDAGEDAERAAELLNEFCDDKEKCQFSSQGNYTTSYSPYRLVGDVLYNCSLPGDEQEPAEGASKITASRSSSTTIGESLTAEVSVNFFELADASLSASVYSKQGTTYKAEATTQYAVTVPPGFKGWTVSKVLQVAYTGDMQITDGPNDIKVTDIDVSVVGHRGMEAPNDWSDFSFSSDSRTMTSDELVEICPITIPAVSVDGVTAAEVAAGAPLRLRMQRFHITVCKPARSGTKPRACVKVPVVGRAETPDRDRVTATLERNGKVYAQERNRAGKVKLVQTRDLRPGRYVLVLHEKKKRYVVKKKGKRLHTVSHEFHTHVPLRIAKWSRRL